MSTPADAKPELHPLLRDQLRLCNLDADASPQIARLVEMVNGRYRAMEAEREPSVQALEPSSGQLAEDVKSVRNILMALDAADDGIAIMDAENRITYANRAMKGIFANLGIENVTGQKLDDLRVGDEFLLPAGVLNQVTPLLHETGRWRGEVVVTPPAATGPRRIVAHLRQLPDGGRVSVVSDITETRRQEEENRRLERQLEQSRKLEALGKVAAGVVHDFNNLLGAILGFAQFIVEDTDETSPIHRYATRIATAGQQAKSLIEQILAFTRRQNAKRETIDLPPLVGETLGILRVLIAPTITLHTDIQDADCRVKAARTEIAQMLNNLIVNASESLAGTAGTITVGLHPLSLDLPEIQHMIQGNFPPASGDSPLASWTDCDGTHHVAAGILHPRVPYIRLFVADTGYGMEPAVAREAFSPFFTTKADRGGTGLGLAVAQNIVLGSGGCLLLSTRPGGGAVFNVLLPRDESEAEPKQGQAAPAPSPAHGSILLVESNLPFGDMLSQALQRLGYDVQTCRNQVEALQRLDQGTKRWDLLITDHMLSHMDGTTLIAEAKRRDPTLPCLICTADVQHLTEIAARTAGADAVASKPIDIATFSALIRRLIDAGPR